jgi:hypothetical protein
MSLRPQTLKCHRARELSRRHSLESAFAGVEAMHGFLPLVPFGADQTIYVVVEAPRQHAPDHIAGKAERTDVETVISDLLAGQFCDPIEVLAFNTIEHWSDNLSKFVAQEIRCRCDIEGHDVPAYLQEFVSRASSVTKAGHQGGAQAWS